ncbi:MAG TPA: cadherin domain-containing protein, partial [Dehalococcoidia bacterium]|nr:cadherin domain-containing protein [Dehalococcoidia bacterium]
TATDGGGLATAKSFLIQVDDRDEERPSVSLANVTEALPENTNVGERIKVADIVVGGGIEAGALHLAGADAARFEIIGEGLYLKGGTPLDYEGKRHFEVRVAASGGVHAAYALVLSDANEAPTNIAIVSGGSVQENAAAGTVVAVLAGSDPDAGDTFTFDLAGASAALFEIDGNRLKVAQGAVLDYEAASQHQLAVTVTDAAGLSYTRSLTIQVRDVSETGHGPSNPIPPDQPPGPPSEPPPVVDLECRGGRGHDRLWGGDGHDRMWGENGHDRLYGGNGNDRIWGGDGNDRLCGDAGADRMWGGRGNDIYEVDHRQDRVYESRGQGTDTVKASVSYSLVGTHVEKLTLTGSADLAGTGNSLANTLTGNAGANTLKGGWGSDVLKGMGGNDRLFGQQGNDKLLGGAGADELRGGGGDDRLTGNSGADIFVFERGGGRDTVTDFRDGQDKLDVSRLAGVDSLADLGIWQSGSDVLLWHGADVLVLKGVSTADLDQLDFIF